MPVDTSIYGNVGKNQLNPFQTMGTVLQMQNLANQNKLFGQTYNTNIALGQIYKNAIDPATGQLDSGKVNALIANNPNVSLALPQAIQQSQAARQQQLQITKDQLDIASKHLTNMGNYFAGLLSKPKGSLTQKDFIDAAGNMIADGLITAPEAARELQNLPNDDASLRSMATQMMLRTMDGQAKVQALYGSPMSINTGQQQVIGTMSPLNGFQPRGVVNNELPPNTPVYNNAAQQPGVLGNTHVGGGGATPSGIPNAAFGGGAPANAPPGGAPVNPAMPGFVPTGAPLGHAAAADVAATGSAKAYQDLRNDVQSTPARIYQLGQALHSLQNTSTGPGTATVNNVKSFLLAQDPGVLKAIGLVDPNSIKSYDEANKYLTAYAANQAGAMGQGTDTKLATALSANANTHISNLAAQDVVKANLGLERIKQAQALAFQNSGLPPEDFSDWGVKWAKSSDPRAYVMDLITPDERKTMISGMKPAERETFLNSLREGIKAGVINMQDLAANGGQ